MPDAAEAFDALGDANRRALLGLLGDGDRSVQQLADEHCDGQYRLIFNTGPQAGQTVFHVHAHLLGGDLTEGSLGQL